MANDIIPVFKNILLICFLPWVIMMYYIWYAVPIPSVRNNSYMVLKYYNIPSVPFFYCGNICGKTYSRV